MDSWFSDNCIKLIESMVFINPTHCDPFDQWNIGQLSLTTRKVIDNRWDGIRKKWTRKIWVNKQAWFPENCKYQFPR